MLLFPLYPLIKHDQLFVPKSKKSHCTRKKSPYLLHISNIFCTFVAANEKAKIMEITAHKNRTFNWCNRFGQICLIIVAFWLVGCASSSRPTICGVPVQGSPWQLAASIHDNGDGTFVPQCVDLVTTTKAYISGYLLPDALTDSLGNPLSPDHPATLICDLENGKVVCAVLHCETIK